MSRPAHVMAIGKDAGARGVNERAGAAPHTPATGREPWKCWDESC